MPDRDPRDTLLGVIVDGLVPFLAAVNDAFKDSIVVLFLG